jgi:hypothetical protein
MALPAQVVRLRSYSQLYAVFGRTADAHIGTKLALILLLGFGSGHLFAQATATGAIQGMVMTPRER